MPQFKGFPLDDPSVYRLPQFKSASPDVPKCPTFLILRFHHGVTTYRNIYRIIQQICNKGKVITSPLCSIICYNNY